MGNPLLNSSDESNGSSPRHTNNIPTPMMDKLKNAILVKKDESKLSQVTVKSKSLQQLTDVHMHAETNLNVSIWCIDVSRSGIIAGCDDGSLHLLTPDLHHIRVIPNAHRGPVTMVVWHTDALHFLSVGVDRSVKVWSISSFSQPLLCVPHSCLVSAACFDPRSMIIEDSAPSSIWLFTVGADGRMRSWRGPLLDQYEMVGSDNKLPVSLTAQLIEGKNGAVLIGIGCQNGQVIILRYSDNMFFVEASIHCKNRHGKYSNGERVVSISWISQDELLVSTHDDRVRLLKLKLRELVPIGKYKGHANHAKSPLIASMVRNYVVSGSEDGLVYVWNRDSSVAERDNTGKHNEIETGDSYEAFIAVERPDRLTACVPAPWEPEKISDSSTDRLPLCVVVATIQGLIRVFYNRGSPKQLEKKSFWSKRQSI
jgi:WD40 repeat protein